MSDLLLPKGIRNNNPGNIRFNGEIQWKGLRGADNGNYCIFTLPIFGIRALALNLYNSNQLRLRKSVRDIQTVYAPTSENDLEAYIKFICEHLDVRDTDPLNLAIYDTANIYVRAIISFENGKPPQDWGKNGEWFSEYEIRIGMNATGKWEGLRV